MTHADLGHQRREMQAVLREHALQAAPRHAQELRGGGQAGALQRVLLQPARAVQGRCRPGQVCAEFGHNRFGLVRARHGRIGLPAQLPQPGVARGGQPLQGLLGRVRQQRHSAGMRLQPLQALACQQRREQAQHHEALGRPRRLAGPQRHLLEHEQPRAALPHAHAVPAVHDRLQAAPAREQVVHAAGRVQRAVDGVGGFQARLRAELQQAAQPALRHGRLQQRALGRQLHTRTLVQARRGHRRAVQPQRLHALHEQPQHHRARESAGRGRGDGGGDGGGRRDGHARW